MIALGEAHRARDVFGTPLFLTNANQLVVWSGDYEPFGEVYDEVIAGTTNEHRFPGQVKDGTTGIYYNWHRYYDPQLGRDYQADPMGLNGGANLYGHVRGDPLLRIDPKALDDDPRFGAALPGDVAPNPYNVINAPVSPPDPTAWPMLPATAITGLVREEKSTGSS